MRRFGMALMLLCTALAPACAVTEPDDRDTARVRAAVAGSGAVSFRDLASDLGISELAVVRALPKSMRVQLPTENLDAALNSACEVSPVRLGFPGVGGESELWVQARMRVETLTDDQLLLHGETGYPVVRFHPSQIVSIWLCQVDGMGPVSRAILFFGSGGARLMTWQVADTPGSIAVFDRVWLRIHE